MKILLYCLFLLVITTLAYWKGRKDVWASEFKVYQANLIKVEGENAEKDLVTFLIARYYYLGNRLPKAYLEGAAKDYGAIKTNLIEGLVVGKGPTSANEEYLKFKANFLDSK